MASVVRRIRSGRTYYYLHHDSKNGARRQHEEYLGKAIPSDVEERKKTFAARIEAGRRLPLLESVKRGPKKR